MQNRNPSLKNTKREVEKCSNTFCSLFLKSIKTKSLSYFTNYFQCFILRLPYPFDIYAYLVQTHVVQSEIIHLI